VSAILPCTDADVEAVSAIINAPATAEKDRPRASRP